jgi:Putative addiction module component
MSSLLCAVATNRHTAPTTRAHGSYRTLSPSNKLALVTELWDDLASNPEDIPITPEQIAEET